jgi:hypothetical protein
MVLGPCVPVPAVWVVGPAVAVVAPEVDVPPPVVEVVVSVTSKLTFCAGARGFGGRRAMTSDQPPPRLARAVIATIAAWVVAAVMALIATIAVSQEQLVGSCGNPGPGAGGGQGQGGVGG